ncbi:MAG: hypothetical protein FJ319_07200 [SAR202 cluster bacterium]|nr:hypothetical protein [SAR202 cluster bacterium]
MARVITSPEQFKIIGENIHTTRIVLRNGQRAVTLPDGNEAVPFKGDDGEDRMLTVPEWFKNTQPYSQGQIKHFMIAARKGIDGGPDEQQEGAAYVRYEVRRQARAGAHFLDLNVDEISYQLEIQKRAMRWLVKVVEAVSPVPPSIDSSNAEIIAEGLAAYTGKAGRPMINSLALERIETLDLVKKHKAHVIVTAAGASGMPSDDEERAENIGQLMEAALKRDVPKDDIHIDALVFPISVDPRYGNHYFDAVRSIRKKWGKEVHIGGGLSNVSFGLPKRKLINDAFIHLGLDAGIDSGIIDPVQSKIKDVFEFDPNTEASKYAIDMLTGKDEFCVNFIQAFRDGKLGK